MEDRDDVAEALHGIRRAILPPEMCRGEDATGGVVGCVVEAIMGISAGLVAVADAIDRLASAVDDRNRIESEK